MMLFENEKDLQFSIKKIQIWVKKLFSFSFVASVLAYTFYDEKSATCKT